MTFDDHAMRKFDHCAHEDFVRMGLVFSPEIEDQIITPHKRERGRTEPILWLLWQMQEDEDYTNIPQLACICTNEYSIRYHVHCFVEQQNLYTESPTSEHGIAAQRMRFHVERTLADHNFGSSLLAEAQAKMIFTKPIVIGESSRYWGGYKHNGD